MGVRVEGEGPVRTVVLDRPEVRNAVDRDTADALVAAFEGLDADGEVRAAVLWGAGGTFCAGADLAGIADGRASGATSGWSRRTPRSGCSAGGGACR
jgi:enoyl-CoA hydratase